MNREGAPLAYSGGSDQRCDVIAAIASNIWSASVKHGQTVFDDELTMQLFDCEVSRWAGMVNGGGGVSCRGAKFHYHATGMPVFFHYRR